MNTKIAVIMKEDDSIASFFETEKIVVFDKIDDSWERTLTIGVPTDLGSGAGELRAATLKIIEELGDCRIIAGGSIVGVPFTELDRFEFYIFEISEYGQDLFDEILADIEDDDEEATLKERIIMEARPVETATPGIYFLDLVALQTECPDVSSKQAMKEFFEKTPFIELDLLCNHIPPWLEGMGLNIIEKKTQDGKFRAVITKEQCGGDL